mmetsp:Transcript_52928/g.59158  ORF Transcript_52928/g.59158 Transcript_52928/m.59158 type:complete len:334 (-) Transcript_52928:69-1070(-)
MAIPTEQSFLTAGQTDDDRTRTKNEKKVDRSSSSSLSYIIGTIVVGLVATIYLASGGSTSGTHLLLSTTNNNVNEAAAAAAAGESALLRSTGTNKKDCVTAEDARETADIFADAVINISEAYQNEEGDEEAKCIAAYKMALGSLQAAYAYQGDTRRVLFKPTLSSAPYTFRNDKAAALSYFIGTKCLNFAAKSSDVQENYVFPPGNEDGSIFDEDGFGLGLVTDSQGIEREGWEAVTKKGPYEEVLSGGDNCETALLVGQICWSANNQEAAGTCVDKTFSFIKNPGPGAPALITSHHSSQVVTGGLTICQDQLTSDEKGPDDLLDPDHPVCDN